MAKPGGVGLTPSAVFSRRTTWSREPNALSVAVTSAARDARYVDLTISNPTAIGLSPNPALLAALEHPGGIEYRPAPLGLTSAREAVAAYYKRRGVEIDPEAVVITATTSEAYTFLFRLLLDPRDRVAAPAPSYPLLSFLAELADVELVPYRLAPLGRWTMDVSTLEAAKAVITVSPNNPTGSTLSLGERSEIVAHARANQGAIIADEVFLDYLIDAERFVSVTFTQEKEALSFSLSGLSKVAGLPQMKLSWIVASGPSDLVAEAKARLEIIADTHLSVATPVQLALPALLDHAERFQLMLRDRLEHNRALLPRDALPSEGGWYAILPLEAGQDDEAFALDLLEAEKIHVHPGYLFDIDRPVIVVSLLPPEETFAEALERVERLR